MSHNENLAAYCTRRAAIARAAGDVEKAERLEANAAYWANLAAL